MPDMSGFDLAAAIKERERTAAIPIVFLTAQATTRGPRPSSARVGAVDYLITPLAPEMVRAKVAVFAQLFRENSETSSRPRSCSRAGTKAIPPDRPAPRRATLPHPCAGGSPHRLDRSPGRCRGLLQSALVRIHGPFGGAGSRFMAGIVHADDSARCRPSGRTPRVRARCSRRSAVCGELPTACFAGTCVALCRSEARPADPLLGRNVHRHRRPKRAQAIQAEFKALWTRSPMRSSSSSRRTGASCT